MSLLSELVEGARADAEARRERVPFEAVAKAAELAAPALPALEFLAAADHVKILAEVKRASPSRGALADIPDAAALAVSYETGGASAISVLTEGRRFAGSLDDLREVRTAVQVPVLRKDFLTEEYQVLEARAAGADLVLLIVSALEQRRLEQLFELTSSLGMTALVETHDADEVSRALDVGAGLIGVNARDLTTFELDQDLFGRLADQIPGSVIRVAESAVRTASDVAHYRRAGADVVLVGEALVTGDPVATLQEFLSA